ncbi:hypothetical protein ACFL52_00390 [Candidatus Margulisiibacteriota bacterium]
MGNDPKIRKIYRLLAKLPFFTLSSLAGVEKDRSYLKILFSRYVKAKKLLRIKQGVYTSKEYLDNLKVKGEYPGFPELIAAIIYQPSYLSMDYILYQHNMLTEIPNNFISVTKNKTKYFKNDFGNYFYHKIAERLYCGYSATKKNSFTVYKATRAKALFDFIYFRKNILTNKKSITELRLNLEVLSKKDKKEFAGYISLEGSKKMEQLGAWLL